MLKITNSTYRLVLAKTQRYCFIIWQIENYEKTKCVIEYDSNNHFTNVRGLIQTDDFNDWVWGNSFLQLVLCRPILYMSSEVVGLAPFAIDTAVSIWWADEIRDKGPVTIPQNEPAFLMGSSGGGSQHYTNYFHYNIIFILVTNEFKVHFWISIRYFKLLFRSKTCFEK